MENIALAVTYFAFVLGIGVIVANLLKKHRIPDPFFLLMIGLLLGPTVFMNPAVSSAVNIKLVDVSAMGEIPNFLRLLALILLVFTGTFNLTFKVFKKFSDVSVNLAFLGVIFNTIVLGFLANLIFGIDLVYCLLLGAVVSGTGNEAIAAFKHSLSRMKNAVTIIELEAIFNTPVAILLPIIFVDFVKIQSGALLEPLKYLNQFWLLVVAGAGTGILVGFGVAKLMKGMMKEYTPLLLLAVALIAYALAESVGGSGMLSVAVCGLIAGNFIFPDRKENAPPEFQDQMTEMLRISVFTLLGAEVMLIFDPVLLVSAFLFFLMVLFVRPLFVMPLLGKRRREFSRKELVLINFVAPRGIETAAMAPLVAIVVAGVSGTAIADRMMNVIFIVVLLSILASTLVAWFCGRGEGKTKRKEEKVKEIPKHKLLEIPEPVKKKRIGKKKPAGPRPAETGQTDLEKVEVKEPT